MPRPRSLARLLAPLVLATACSSTAHTPVSLGGRTASPRPDQASPSAAATAGSTAPAGSAAAVSPPTVSPSSGPSNDLDTVSGYFEAINHKDWPRAWALGGRNLNPSYDQMIAGYARTASDDPTIYGHHSPDVSVALLARSTDGTTQLFTGDYTVTAGVITRGTLKLRGNDHGHLAGGYAGYWGGHGRSVTITPGGLGIVSYRTYQDCRPGLAEPCDAMDGIYIVDGGLELFQITTTTGSHATARTIAQQDIARPERLTLSEHGHVLDLDNYPSGSFCDDHAPADICGA